MRAVSDERGLYTFWDYQAGAWQKNDGIRIDHLLLSPQAADRLIDRRHRQARARLGEAVRPRAGLCRSAISSRAVSSTARCVNACRSHPALADRPARARARRRSPASRRCRTARRSRPGRCRVLASSLASVSHIRPARRLPRHVLAVEQHARRAAPAPGTGPCWPASAEPARRLLRIVRRAVAVEIERAR